VIVTAVTADLADQQLRLAIADAVAPPHPGPEQVSMGAPGPTRTR